MASSPFTSSLVTPYEFHNVSGTSSSRIIPVAAGRAPLRPSYEKQHIPGSIFFDMDMVTDTTSPYPQMLPTASQFAAYMGQLGIRPDDILVVYDAFDVGTYSAPRVAWTCRYFGHQAVHVLNNFRSYVEQKFPISEGEMLNLPPIDYPVSEPDPHRTISFDELRRLVLQGSREYQIIDSRISGRFSGVQEEADPSLRSGHMPSAINIPLAAMLDTDTKAFLPLDRLKTLFQNAGVQQSSQLILTCNSGVTAASLDLVLQELGFGLERRLYDGSWMEWTRRAEDPLVIRD
ncbi:thiosulfate sulfurtransferase, putative [Paecilomyces variotii No. 5]|uniref:Thiosulfate sulfurtransferase, putative n=1 Tax=Byssochlamys spectabilis (strain No. 5 / NBRC 109023) TaxID=1356009 RepID=V5I4S1_BYSSN|nr:thiosulfate sulfurtransferase, putative [Paecilomyces variotii No. 5]